MLSEDDLIRFETDPQEDKVMLSDEIQRQTDEFLARGGEVESVDYGESSLTGHPIKRTRKDQVAYNKRRWRIKTCPETD